MTVTEREELEGFILKKAKSCVAMKFSKEWIDEIRVNVSEEHVFEDLIGARFTTAVLHVGDTEHRCPADWWQALRARWFPSWWLARWPIEYRSFRTWHGVCPHHSIPRGDVHMNWLRDYARENGGVQ